MSKEDKITIVNKHNELRLLVAQGKVTSQPKAINMKKLVWFIPNDDLFILKLINLILDTWFKYC